MVRIKRVDKSLPLPQYQTEGSVGFDIYSRIDGEIESRQTKIFPSNLIIEVPSRHFLMIAARSSLTEKGLMLANGVGIIDQDYHGPQDEIGILLYNFSDKKAEIKKGERIAQGLIIPIQRAQWEEVEELKKDSRGGFGSTGL